MPAGRLVKYVPRKRTFRRKSNFRKAVTAIARKATMRMAEQKYNVTNLVTSMGVNGVLSPMFANIAQGTAQNQRIGDDIRATHVTIRGYIQQDPAVITARQDDNAVRVLLCSGKRPLTTGDMPGFKDAIDYEKITPLRDYYINFSTTKKCKWFKTVVKFPRNIPFEGSAPNKNELYLWLIPYGGTGITTTTGNYVNLNFHSGFKDL